MIESIDMTQFVPKYFEMDPKTDDLLRKGSMLEEGMEVLLERPDMRVDVLGLAESIKSGTNPSLTEQALRWNRWATVSDLGWGEEGPSFIGIYHDGTKKKIEVADHLAWYVKKKSMPKPIDDEAEKLDQQERGRPISNVGAAMVESMKQFRPR
jgi:hypothetical protein